MKNTKVSDCYKKNLNEFIDKRGTLQVIENVKDINNNLIKFKRCYVLSDFKNNQVRGQHAHRKLYQLVFPLNGSFSVNLYDGFNEKVVNLSDGSALVIVPGIWRELSNYSDNLFVVVLASDKYDVDDYIYSKCDFDTYKRI